MTPKQLTTIHAAARKAGLSEPDYRTVLRSVAHVESAKDLKHDQFEAVMAAIEEIQDNRGKTTSRYWRDKTSSASTRASSRAIYYLRNLAKDLPINANGHNGAEQLRILTLAFSGSRTADPSQLTPQEAYRLTEAIKTKLTAAQRHARRTAQGTLFVGAAVPPAPAPAPDPNSALSTQDSELSSGWSEPPLTEEEIPF